MRKIARQIIDTTRKHAAKVATVAGVAAVNANAAVLDTNLTSGATEMSSLWSDTLRPLFWSVALASVGIAWLLRLKGRKA